MTGRGQRFVDVVPTRRGALLLFGLALAVFGLQALGWPLAKGRRAPAVREVVGEADGRAAERVAGEIVDAVGRK